MEPEKRLVRVFISSTFKDMQPERDELVEFTFPELRRRCRSRRVEFVGVDLRWGITDEQTAEGKVLPICLAEIEGCRPYFVGLLGKRYGWVPRSIDEELLQRQSWLKKHKEKSVTELEILHGVLNDPKMLGLAFFYFRKREASEDIEGILSREPGYEPEPETSHAKLKILKERIEASSYPLRKDYPDARTLGQWVLEDLWSAIDKRYPIEEVPTELQQRRMDHHAFASLRRLIYIGGKEYFDVLDRHVQGNGPPLMILGESGSGKSALLANWAHAYQQQHPDDFIVCHYIGSAKDSSDYIQILKRVMEEIKERYEPDPKEEDDKARYSPDRGYIPANLQRMAEAFPEWLGRAAAKGRFILILDALNQLEDRDNAPDLGWLPSNFPPNVRLIVSTLPGRSQDALKKRDWLELTVNPMKPDDQRQYIVEYLARYGKSLKDSQIKRIAAATQASNALYLRTLLEELQVFGKYDELNREIDRYLKAETVEDLFALMLDRLEDVYERERKGLVGEVTTLLWASRMGLSETELLELLGGEGGAMPRAIFSPLYLALEESLVNRSGLLTFFHGFLRTAVQSRYLKDPQFRQRAHLKIADHFSRKTLDNRKIDELPWQLCQAASWPRVKDCISDMQIFPQMVRQNKAYELIGYWQALADRFDLVSAYKDSIEKYEKHAPCGNNLAYRLNQTAYFLMQCGKYLDAEPLFRRALDIRVKVLGPHHLYTALSYSNLAWFHETMSSYEEALSWYYKALEIRNSALGYQHVETADILACLAGVYEKRGDYIGAEAFYQETWTIREGALGPQHPGTASCIHSLSWLYFCMGKYKEALALCLKALSIRENKLGPEHPDTSNSLNNLALIYRAQGDCDRALPPIRRSLDIDKKIYGSEHPEVATALQNYALILIDKGEYNEAEPLLRKALEIRGKAFGWNHPATAYAEANLGWLFQTRGDYASAESFYRKALAIREQVHGLEHPDTASTLHSLSSLYYHMGRYQEALPLCLRALSVREKTLGPDHPGTSWSLNDLSLIYRAMHDYDRALPLIQRALQISEKANGPEHPEVALNLSNCALLLMDMKKYEIAEPILRRALDIREKALGAEHPLVIDSLANLAQLFEAKGDGRGAKPFRERAAEIRKKRAADQIQ